MKITRLDRIINNYQEVPLDLIKLIYTFVMCNECKDMNCRCCKKCEKYECECKHIIINMYETIDKEELLIQCCSCQIILLVFSIPILFVISVILKSTTLIIITAILTFCCCLLSSLPCT